jgi:hypothetical protein
MRDFMPCAGCDEPEACEIVSRCLEPAPMSTPEHRYWSTEQQRWVYPGEADDAAKEVLRLACEWYDTGSGKDAVAHELALAVLRYKQATDAAASLADTGEVK